MYIYSNAHIHPHSADFDVRKQCIFAVACVAAPCWLCQSFRRLVGQNRRWVLVRMALVSAFHARVRCSFLVVSLWHCSVTRCSWCVFLIFLSLTFAVGWFVWKMKLVGSCRNWCWAKTTCWTWDLEIASNQKAMRGYRRHEKNWRQIEMALADYTERPAWSLLNI